MKYLFDCLDIFKKELTDKYVFLFLDYDGTLTPIVEVPGKAIITKKARCLLKSLLKTRRFKLAIISGRALKDIKRLVAIRGIIYSGNHGLEIECPRLKYSRRISQGYIKILEQIKKDLNKKLSFIKGAFIEDKGLSLSVHYRLVKKKFIPHLKTIFHETVALYTAKGKIEIRPGKMVLEVRPPVEWDKGKIVLWLLARQLVALDNKAIFPIYIGDDTTDEDAFKALKNKGITVFVGKPKRSFAKYYLKDTKGVLRLLNFIKNLKQKEDSWQN